MTQTFDPFAEVPPQPAEDGHGYCRLADRVRLDAAGRRPARAAARIVRRRKWVVLQALVLVTLVAFLYSKHEPTQYTASAGLLFGNPTQDVLPGAATSDAALDPTGRGATNSSLCVAARGVDICLEADGREDLRRGDPVERERRRGSRPDSNVATISATSSSPQRAAEIANAYGNGYIAFRRGTTRPTITASINRITAELDKLAGGRGRS